MVLQLIRGSDEQYKKFLNHILAPVSSPNNLTTAEILGLQKVKNEESNTEESKTNRNKDIMVSGEAVE